MIRARWTHALCERCWAEDKPGREPVRVSEPQEEQCCRCGKLTSSGIYGRAEPGTFAHCTHLDAHPADSDGIFEIKWSSDSCFGCGGPPVRAACFEDMKLTIILQCCARLACWKRVRAAVPRIRDRQKAN